MLSDSRVVPTDDAAMMRQTVPRDVTNPAAEVSHTTEQVRAAQLEETLDAALGGAVIHVPLAAALLVFFSSSSDWIYAAFLLGVTAVAALAALGASRSTTLRKAVPAVVVAAHRITLVLACVLGLAWGTVSIALSAQANANQRLVLVAAIVVVIGDLYRFGAIKWASFFYAVPLCLGSCVGFALSGSIAGFVLAAVMPFYGWLLLSQNARASAAAARRTIDRFTVVEQTHTIQALLLDFDDNTSDWLWRTDPDGCFVNASAGVFAAMDLPIDHLDGAKFETIFARLGTSPPTGGAHAVLAAFAARKPFRNQLVEINASGTVHWWRLAGKPLFDAAGRYLGYRGIGSDMTGARNSESRIVHLANYDALTGFANRANFQTFAARQCAMAAIDGHYQALLSLDLDGFKSVNDGLGHEGGDELLRQAAARLTASAPVGAFIARLGADEFAFWLQPTTPAKAEAVARALIEVLKVPFDINGLKVNIGASVGIAFTPKHTIDPNDLLIKADLALYRAKEESKGDVCVFMPAFETTLIERRKLEGDLKLALARGEFVMHYQPILDVAQGRVVSFEALIRWQSPERGFVSPAEFIPAAETMGLIAPIGRWVLLEACRAAVEWPRDVGVAINVSPPHLRSPEFMQDVVMALKISGLHPSRLEIEVTEGVLLDKSSAALETLRTLRTRGIRIALDDFGTGYSSLTYLMDFPVDKIKIDRSFVQDFVDSQANQAIVDAILGLARKLSMKVTAEGVETKEQALALKRSRCDEIQGYLLSRPRPRADVPAMIASVPTLFRDAVPVYMDSPLAMALTAKKAAV